MATHACPFKPFEAIHSPATAKLRQLLIIFFCAALVPNQTFLSANIACEYGRSINRGNKQKHRFRQGMAYLKK
jgi:hypothetical protein